MVKTFTDSYNQTTNKVSAEEFPLSLVKLDHPDLVTPIFVVNDRTDVVSNGDTYVRFAFTLTRPNDPENGIPEARLVMDNVGRELMQWIEIADWNKPTTVVLSSIMRSAPDIVEWTVTMGLTNIEITQSHVSGKLGFEDLLGVAGMRVNYTPVTAVGLF